MTQKADKTFLNKKITNKDIYDEIIGIKDALSAFKTSNETAHEEIKTEQTKTNGKVTLAKLIGSTALTLSILGLGFLIGHIGAK